MSRERWLFRRRLPDGEGISPVPEEVEDLALQVDEAFVDRRAIRLKDGHEAARLDIIDFGEKELPRYERMRQPRNPWLNRRQRRWALSLSAGVLAVTGAVTAIGLTTGHDGSSNVPAPSSGVFWPGESTTSQSSGAFDPGESTPSQSPHRERVGKDERGPASITGVMHPSRG